MSFLRRHHSADAGASRRILVPFTRGHLDQTVLDAAIRVARAEDATLVPAYLILIPAEFPLDAPMSEEYAQAIPLLEAVEHAASKAGIPVDARWRAAGPRFTPSNASGTWSSSTASSCRRLWDADPASR